VQVIVVGAGIVGLACAHHLVGRGHAVTLIDRGTPTPGCSHGNAGGIAVTEVVPQSVPGLWEKVPVWLADPFGPLHIRPTHAPRMLPWLSYFMKAARNVEWYTAALASLNGLVWDELGRLLADVGLGHTLHRTGCLVVYSHEAARRRDALEWRLKREHGVVAEDVDRSAITDLEPAIGPTMTAGVFQPDWATVDDPAEICTTLFDTLRRRGVDFVEGEAAQVERGPDNHPVGVSMADGRLVEGTAVVIAAGAWSKALARTVGDFVHLESERGYNATLPNPRIAVTREVAFGERKFVVTPLSCGLRVGGAAEFAGLGGKPNYLRSTNLVTAAKKALPGLNSHGMTRWMGHRPATPDSLPVIGPSEQVPNVVHAFGHGHLGLTQAAPTGRIVADLIDGREPPIDLTPFRVMRFFGR